MFRSVVACITLALLTFSSTLVGGQSKVGTTAYPFLKIGVGAKALAMGGAFVGLANDESALYYNPAGLVGLTARSVSASYMNYIADIQSGNLMLVIPRGVEATDEYLEEENPISDARSTFAFGLNYLNYGDIDETNASGQVIDQFGGSDMAFTFAYSAKANRQLAVGAGVKFIYQKIDEYDSQGLAADIGLLYRLKDGRTNIGFSASNLGFQLSGLSENHKDPLPILIRAGLSHQLREIPLTVSGEGVVPSDNDVYGSLGVEFHPDLPLAFRAGYSSFGSNYKTDGDKDGTAGLSFGAGFKLPKLNVDYAYLPYADLGSLHRVNLAYQW
ncbi:MAG: PorV/PorQ family protein [candidate division Zixibacteria bacterium]|nr:PorV/PorQ family protein [candidate division Zixibacteria bacterium]